MAVCDDRFVQCVAGAEAVVHTRVGFHGMRDAVHPHLFLIYEGEDPGSHWHIHHLCVDQREWDDASVLHTLRRLALYIRGSMLDLSAMKGLVLVAESVFVSVKGTADEKYADALVAEHRLSTHPSAQNARIGIGVDMRDALYIGHRVEHGPFEIMTEVTEHPERVQDYGVAIQGLRDLIAEFRQADAARLN